MKQQNSNKPASENEVPYIDDGWWESILADEELFQPHEISTIRTPITTNLSGVDWERVQELFEQDAVITLEVTGFNRGGILVGNNDVQGFVPISHLVEMPNIATDEERQQKLSEYVGQKVKLKVIECEPTQERIVFSERAALAGEGKRKMLFHTLKNGDVVSGFVTNITDFGVFVDLGGVEGLIHVSELSWGRVQHPSEIVEIDEEVTAQVLQINEKSGRVALSLKQLTPNPWIDITKIHKPGDVLIAKVTAIMNFGVFARLEEGIEGLIHISSMQLTEDRKDIKSNFYPGQSVQVEILHIDVDRRRLGLGLVSIE